ncbi:hypothetical protein L7F22_014592 [Adiantum nelumboides]|nr:hypothetical protein [Adiantum nelumboides]
MALLKISTVVPTRWHQASRCFPKRGRRRAVVATIEICKPDDFEVGRLLGTFGYMNVTSYIPPPQMGITEPLGLDQWDMERRMSGQEVGQGGVQVRLYTGRFTRGPRRGTRVVLKAYPGRNAGSAEADAMAANELATHAVLQLWKQYHVQCCGLDSRIIVMQPGHKFTYKDLIYSKMELPLRLISQHFKVQKPPRYTEPILHIAVVLALGIAKIRVVCCDMGKYILENLVEANLRGSDKN